MTAVEPIVATLGPLGVLITIVMLGGFLGSLFLYFRFGVRALRPTLDAYHQQNTQALTDIEGQLGEVLKQLQLQNGRLGTIEEWRRSHDKQDDEREERHTREHGELWSESHRVRERVHVVGSDLQRVALGFRPKGEAE